MSSVRLLMESTTLVTDANCRRVCSSWARMAVTRHEPPTPRSSVGLKSALATPSVISSRWILTPAGSDEREP